MTIEDNKDEVELFGRGISLEQRARDDSEISWDLGISDDGDIKLNRGVAELEKDLAFKIAIVLDVATGAVLEPRVLIAMKNRVRTVCEDDERVDLVRDVTIEKSDSDGDRINITANLRLINPSGAEITLSTQL